MCGRERMARGEEGEKNTRVMERERENERTPENIVALELQKEWNMWAMIKRMRHEREHPGMDVSESWVDRSYRRRSRQEEHFPRETNRNGGQ